MADPAVEAVDLVKSYPAGRNEPPITALRGLSFAAARGTVFGLLGPNGAGKSTAVKMLSTLSTADSGSARVAGIDVGTRPEQVRRVIGVVSQKSGTEGRLDLRRHRGRTPAGVIPGSCGVSRR